MGIIVGMIGFALTFVVGSFAFAVAPTWGMAILAEGGWTVEEKWYAACLWPAFWTFSIAVFVKGLRFSSRLVDALDAYEQAEAAKGKG